MAASITELANAIAKDTTLVDDYFEKRNLPKPSFNEDGPSNIRIPPSSPDVAAAHARAVAATRELHALLQGPSMGLRTIFQINDLLALQFIYRFEVANHVPVGNDISFEELSRAAGIDQQTLTRVLRYGFTNWLFRETRPGCVGHTAATRAMHDSKGTRDSVGLGVNEGLSSSFNVVDALQKYGASSEPNESGWALANSATQPFFMELALRHPERSAVVAGAMEAYSAGIPLDPLFEAYDFSAAGHKVVDIGGGHGQVSIGIAKRYPDMHCIVQDLPEVIKAAESTRKDLSDDIKHRVEYQFHDFFDEQPVKDADLYLYRAVFHNWSDKYCFKALKALVPALKKGTRVVIIDSVMPEPGVAPPAVERLKMAVDLNMMTYFNARERTLEDWKDLFAKADDRLKFQGVKSVGKGGQAFMMASVMEAIWEP